jgi:hypothetical protein
MHVINLLAASATLTLGVASIVADNNENKFSGKHTTDISLSGARARQRQTFEEGHLVNERRDLEKDQLPLEHPDQLDELERPQISAIVTTTATATETVTVKSTETTTATILATSSPASETSALAS